MWRYRCNWRGKLILQIGTVREPDDNTQPGRAPHIVWRDAKVEDMPILENEHDKKYHINQWNVIR